MTAIDSLEFVRDALVRDRDGLPWSGRSGFLRPAPRVGGTSLPAAADHDRPTPPPPRSEPEAPSRRTWIAIELHDEHGRPCAEAAWRIRLPDGKEQTGWLDDAGRAAVHGIEPGTCQVCFPDFDGGAWHGV